MNHMNQSASLSRQCGSALGLRSGEVARLAQINPQTLRYYERRGLLPKPPRRPSGYRIYPPDTVARIRFIKRAQELGFSLREIQELLALREIPWSSCSDVAAIAQRKIEQIAAKIRDLRRIQWALRTLLQRCPRTSSIQRCPIIEALIQPGECSEACARIPTNRSHT
ncbi:Mercuric resistance operon regulatory protein [bacterium HR36]|nr:Mercuric resistance operon regulatory protein [bacterium HR36]